MSDKRYTSIRLKVSTYTALAEIARRHGVALGDAVGKLIDGQIMVDVDRQILEQLAQDVATIKTILEIEKEYDND